MSDTSNINLSARWETKDWTGWTVQEFVPGSYCAYKIIDPAGVVRAETRSMDDFGALWHNKMQRDHGIAVEPFIEGGCDEAVREAERLRDAAGDKGPVLVTALSLGSNSILASAVTWDGVYPGPLTYGSRS